MRNHDEPFENSTWFSILRAGVFNVIVCTYYDDAETTRRLNNALPTGLATGWQVATDRDDHHIPCQDNPTTHMHVLFEC